MIRRDAQTATAIPADPPLLVSVIVPAFNADETVRDAVASALEGSYANIEVIIVDDGSTDDTAVVAEQLTWLDARVQLHRRERGGVSAALNSGLALAQGKYVARLDADDLWHRSKLERQVELALNDPDAAFIYCFVRYIDDRGCVVRDAAPQPFPRHALCRGIYESLIGGNSSALIKRSAAEAVGGYDESLSSWEDLLLQLRISAAYPIAFVPEYLVGYRIRPGSLSADPANMLRSWRAARAAIEDLFPVVPRFVRDWAHGKRCAELAEGFAWHGRPLRTAALLAEAARHDPEWTTRFLGYRVARSWGRHFSPGEKTESGPHFRHCKPEEQVRLGAYDSGVEGRLLRPLEAQRKEQLTKLDDRLLRRGGGA